MKLHPTNSQVRAPSRLRIESRETAIELARSLRTPQERVGQGSLFAAVDDWAFERLYSRATTALNAHSDAETACRYLDAAIAIKPSTDALYARSAALALLDEPANSLRDIEQYIKEVSEDPSAHALRGDDLHELGKTNEAIAAYTRALQLHDDYHVVRLVRGTCYLEQGDFRLAIADFKHVEPFVEAGDKSYWASRATAHEALGQRNEAAICRQRSAGLRRRVVR